METVATGIAGNYLAAFKSHHSGMETIAFLPTAGTMPDFKSHHSGMETDNGLRVERQIPALNRTIVGWKRVGVLPFAGPLGETLNRTIVGWKPGWRRRHPRR